MPKLKRRPTYTPCINGLPTGSTHHDCDQLLQARSPGLRRVSARQVPRAPLPTNRCYLLRCDVLHHIRKHYHSFIAHTGSWARPKPSRWLRLSLFQPVFAGCCRSLLGDGPSRRYLCNLYIGAWTLTPWCFSGALTRFFPENFDLTLDLQRSAHQITPAMQLQQGTPFRDGSHFVMFRLPCLLDPQVAPTAVTLRFQGGRAVYTTQWTESYLPELWHHYMPESGN